MIHFFNQFIEWSKCFWSSVLLRMRAPDVTVKVTVNSVKKLNIRQNNRFCGDPMSPHWSGALCRDSGILLPDWGLTQQKGTRSGCSVSATFAQPEQKLPVSKLMFLSIKERVNYTVFAIMLLNKKTTSPCQ